MAQRRWAPGDDVRSSDMSTPRVRLDITTFTVEPLMFSGGYHIGLPEIYYYLLGLLHIQGQVVICM